MSLVNALKKSFSIGPSTSNDISDDSPFTFVKTRKAMLRELSLSKENGTLVGIYSKALGDGMFLVGINNIEDDTPKEIIVFETYDQSGAILNRTQVSLDEIKMVCPFNKKYTNPVLTKLHIV